MQLVVLSDNYSCSLFTLLFLFTYITDCDFNNNDNSNNNDYDDEDDNIFMSVIIIYNEHEFNYDLPRIENSDNFMPATWTQCDVSIVIWFDNSISKFEIVFLHRRKMNIIPVSDAKGWDFMMDGL